MKTEKHTSSLKYLAAIHSRKRMCSKQSLASLSREHVGYAYFDTSIFSPFQTISIAK